MDFQSFFTELMLPATYILFGFALVSVILLPLIKSLDDPATLVKSGVGVAVLLVFFLIGWVLSGDEVTAKFASFNVDASLSKFIGGSLIMFYILGGVTILALLYSEVSRFFK